MHPLITTGERAASWYASRTRHSRSAAARLGRWIPGPRAPVPAGPPRRCLQDHTAAVLHRDVGMTAEIRLQGGCPAGVIQQNECRELRQVEPFIEDEVGLQPRVG